jgi:hypothetical protein
VRTSNLKAYRILMGETGKRPFEKSKRRPEDNIKMDIN